MGIFQVIHRDKRGEEKVGICQKKHQGRSGERESGYLSSNSSRQKKGERKREWVFVKQCIKADEVREKGKGCFDFVVNLGAWG